MAKNAVITGWGFYAPSRVLTNADLERIVDTSDEWITSRTGIKERRIASDGETTSTMSIRAARQAISKNVTGPARQYADMMIAEHTPHLAATRGIDRRVNRQCPR